MRLKTLELSGFKSFVDRTVLHFEEGVTGVVGPNGCGKSNIVDAIRWVMGEMSAKHLRGLAMEDVIFNGCESRAPVGMAQVFLTFDNSDGRAPAEYAQYSEIQLGRRLYRSGESEYFINKTPCRLKDIVDLFLGTGVGTKAYSIVEQGMIGAIVSSKPEDRRVIIEEAAGISKFKARKEAALRKMESTKQNLARLNDIMTEMARQIGSLNRQAKKAERHQRISEELKEKELGLAATRFGKIRQECEELSSQYENLKIEETSSSAELSSFELEIESMRLSLVELERELDGVQEDLYRAEHSIKLYESEIGHRTKERETLAVQIGSYASEIESLKEKRAELNIRTEEANAAMVLADLKLASSSDVVSVMESEVAILRADFNRLQDTCNELKGEELAYTSTMANLNSTLEQLERRHIDVTGRIAKNQTEIDAVDVRLSEIEGDVASYDGSLSALRNEKNSHSDELEKNLNKVTKARKILGDVESSAAKKRDELSIRRARLASLCELRKNLEGYREGVRAVLARTDPNGEKLNGVLGTVSDFVEVEPEFEPALGAVLGEKLQYVVVKSHEEGVDAIDYLRTASCGRSTFVPLALRAATASQESLEPVGEGVVGPIKNYVRFADDYKHICDHLLGDVVVVEDLGRALSLWGTGNYQKTFVTKDGSVVDPSGFVTGGVDSSHEEQLVTQKRRIKELEEEVSLIESELSVCDMEVARYKRELKEIEEKVESTRKVLHAKDIELVGEESDLNRLTDEIKRYERERDRLSVEIANLTEELDENEVEKTLARSKIENKANSRTSDKENLIRIQTELETASEKLSAKERELIDFRVELAKAVERAGSVEREISGIVELKTEAILGIDKRISDINMANAKIVALAGEIENFKADLDLAIRSVTRLRESQRVLKERYDADSLAIKERELAVREIRKKHDETLSSFHGVELKLTEHRGKMQYLSDNIRERYHLDLAIVEAQYVKDDLDMDSEELLVNELKEKIDSIGPVNIDAIKEFEELLARQEFLTRQNADLTASLDNLSKAIAKINRTSRQRFRRAFDAVDAQFQMLFPKLFRGGQAKLMLTDEENLLETGVEIVAQPPGKKLQSITLLSGGEKALTAVALIFSIFLIKPSPFCLLDEVDAPLDDANIDRFNDLIRSMTPHSQFILITHNKRTMELADLLYGVTMEEAGVSKMVSVRLGVDREAEAAVA